MKKEFTTHEEVDAYFKKELAFYEGCQDMQSMLNINEIFSNWKYAKEDIDRKGYWPPRNARIMNLTLSSLPKL